MQFWSNGETPEYLGDIFSMTPSLGTKQLHFGDEDGQFTIRLEQMKCALDESLLRAGVSFADHLYRHHVPADAERYEAPHSHQVIYAWKVGMVSLEDYERLFDMEAFVPFDTSRDPEYASRMVRIDSFESDLAPLTYVAKGEPPYLGGGVVNSVLGVSLPGAGVVTAGDSSSWSSSRFSSFSGGYTPGKIGAGYAPSVNNALGFVEAEAKPFTPWSSSKGIRK